MKKNFFDNLNDWVNDTEGSLVNFLTAFSPWLAPLAPAYMTYEHMIGFLHFDRWLALVLATLVEILGFGTVSTALDFWFYNRKEKANMKKAPLQIVIGVFAFYIVLILFSNVVIDISTSYFGEGIQKGAIILVRALLTLQTIPGALIVAVRTGHREILREIKREKEELYLRKVTESSSNPRGESSQITQNFPKDWRKVRPTLSQAQVIEIANWTSSQIRVFSQKYGIEERTLVNWRIYANKELGNEK